MKDKLITLRLEVNNNIFIEDSRKYRCNLLDALICVKGVENVHILPVEENDFDFLTLKKKIKKLKAKNKELKQDIRKVIDFCFPLALKEVYITTNKGELISLIFGSKQNIPIGYGICNLQCDLKSVTYNLSKKTIKKLEKKGLIIHSR